MYTEEFHIKIPICKKTTFSDGYKISWKYCAGAMVVKYITKAGTHLGILAGRV